MQCSWSTARPGRSPCPASAQIRACAFPVSTIEVESSAHYGDPPNKSYFLWDGERLTLLDQPAATAAPVDFIDLNNRGQILGRSWDPSPRMYQALLREVDGTTRPIEWAYPWPDSIQVRAYSREDVTVRWIQSQGTLVHGMNDRGDILASVAAQYEGQLANGTSYWHYEVIHGIGRPHREPSEHRER